MWERVEWLVDIVLLIKNKKLNLERIIEKSKEINVQKIVVTSILICERILKLKVHKKIENYIDKNIIKIVDRYVKKLENDYIIFEPNIHNKQISYIQWLLLDDKIRQIKYLKSMITPTENDYQKIMLPQKLSFIYFIYRPFNILFKFFKNKFK